jgi:hypothetical protein
MLAMDSTHERGQSAQLLRKCRTARQPSVDAMTVDDVGLAALPFEPLARDQLFDLPESPQCGFDILVVERHLFPVTEGNRMFRSPP